MLSLGQDDHRIQPAAGLVEARVRRDLGDVDVAVAEEVDGADVVVGVGLQAVALHLPGDVDEGAIKRIAGQREERSEEHTSELQSLMRISYAVFCLKKKRRATTHHKRDYRRNT